MGSNAGQAWFDLFNDIVVVLAQGISCSPLLTVPADILAFIFTNGAVLRRIFGFGKLRPASLANEFGHQISF
ncbi:MAG: hypothetical protein P8Z00_24825 [Anaerolineales bacterium]